jgi:hypothetical protein
VKNPFNLVSIALFVLALAVFLFFNRAVFALGL